MKSILEVWKPVRGYSDYEVSDSGVVRSLKHGRVRYLKLNKQKHGYIQVAFCKNGKMKYVKVHRLVWEAFNGPIPSGMQIDHINTVRDDNRLENLRVATPKENSNNPITAERIQEANRRNSENQVVLNNRREGVRRVCTKPIVQLDKTTGEVIRHWYCIADAWRKLGICRADISKCCNGKRKSAGGFRWRYATENDD